MSRGATLARERKVEEVEMRGEGAGAVPGRGGSGRRGSIPTSAPPDAGAGVARGAVARPDGMPAR
jgi:hypothetical protein